jgi:uncharacterized membrane protein (DUF106 family)
MEELLDNLWFKIMDLIHYFVCFLDYIFAPLNFLGPVFAISTIAFITVVITKFLTKVFKTKRYEALKKEFKHWYDIRQEATKCEDHEKAKLLAKNIDQAKLNQVYYNFFFEGFMLGLATKYLPIFSFLAYVNEAYKAENLMKLFGRDYIFRFAGSGPKPVLVGAIFWFIVSILLIYLCWFLIERRYKKVIVKQDQSGQ